MAGEPTFVDLNELLEEYDLVALAGAADLSELALEVKLSTINALLLGRAPDVLDPQGDQFELFLEALSGATSEVEAIVGTNPGPATRRTLALRAIAYGTAADLEESLFPEQQQGDGARAAYLRRRYDVIIGMLAEQDTSGVVHGPLSPTGSFPAARPYPDGALGSDGFDGRGERGYSTC